MENEREGGRLRHDQVGEVADEVVVDLDVDGGRGIVMVRRLQVVEDLVDRLGERQFRLRIRLFRRASQVRKCISRTS